MNKFNFNKEYNSNDEIKILKQKLNNTIDENKILTIQNCKLNDENKILKERIDKLSRFLINFG